MMSDQLAMARFLEHIDGELRDILLEHIGEHTKLAAGAPMRIDLAARGRGRHELLHVEGGRGVHHRAARRDGENGKRVGLTSREVTRTLNRVHGDIGLERCARAAEPLAARRLGGFALPGFADHHHRVDIDAGKRDKHGIERSTTAVHAVAAADPVEGRKSRALGHAA